MKRALAVAALLAFAGCAAAPRFQVEHDGERLWLSIGVAPGIPPAFEDEPEEPR